MAWHRRAALLAALVLLGVHPGCTTGSDPTDSTGATPDDTGTGVSSAVPAMFEQGCPVGDQALARTLETHGPPMAGSRVVSDSGDFLLANERAAFVVAAPVSSASPQRTWYHYGGIVVDAAAIDGCAQVSLDGIDEVGFAIGQLNLASFNESVLRAFRADAVEVLNDGSDGEAAVVRASGNDDFLQLIEYQLIREAAASGVIKPLSEPIGVRMEVDYVLEPDDPVLQITTRVVAEIDGVEPLLGGALVTWGDELKPIHRPESLIEVGGFTLNVGTPWQLALGERGSFAFAVSNANQAIASISGVEAFIDANQAAASPLTVPEAGLADEMTFLLAVGGPGESPVDGLVAHDADLGPGPAEVRPISGTVVGATGDPVEEVRVDIQMARAGGEWETFDAFFADPDGSFSGSVVALLGDDGVEPALRLRFVAPGRAEVFAELPTGDVGPSESEYELGPAGSLDVAVTDDAGEPLPSRLTFYRAGDEVAEIDTVGSGTEPIAPGTYDVVVSRGYEYDRVEKTVTVPDGGSTSLDAELHRVVDTSGWLSLDTHVHTAPSPDSTLSPEDRLRDASATGLEVIVNTNHEIIEDLEPRRQASGLAGWVSMISGQEVTASSPEHTTMYPVEPDGTVRGGPPEWYGLDIAQIYALEAERGATVRGLNHPRKYLAQIEFDPVTGTAGLADPTVIGLFAGAELWSWDFEQIELQNGADPVLASAGDEEGIFDAWQSSFNHGHRVTAVAASDAHGIGVGESFTYVRVDDDDPASVTAEAVADAVVVGRAVLSAGAFAEVLVDGAGPGETASPAGPDGVEVALRVQSAPGIDVDTIRVFANCDEVLVIDVTPTRGAVRYDDVIRIDLAADANLTVLGFGSEPLPRPFRQVDSARVPRFVTNPVFVDVDGTGAFDPPGDKACEYPR